MRTLPPSMVAALAALAALSVLPSIARERAIVVSPANLNGWVFFSGAVPEDALTFISGPDSAPLGAGSVILAASDSAQRSILATSAYAGTRLDDLTVLKFSARRIAPDAGPAGPVLTLAIDYDLTDTTGATQGELVFDPSLNGNVHSRVWETWDAFAGKWYMTGTAIEANAAAGQPFPAASPGTLTQILAEFPNAGVRIAGNLAFLAGGPAGTFTAAVDALIVARDGEATTWNFEPDTDGDTLADIFDQCPDSDFRSKVDVGTGATTVTNSVDDHGCTIQDLVNKAETAATSHRKYVKAISRLADDLYRVRTITKTQRMELKAGAEASTAGN